MKLQNDIIIKKDEKIDKPDIDLINELKKLYFSKIGKDEEHINILQSSMYKMIKYIKIINDIDIKDLKLSTFRININNNKYNYCYIYSSYKGGTFTNKYIIISSSIKSKDGMYSYRLIDYEILSKIKELNNISDFIIENINKKKLNSIKVYSTITNKNFIDNLQYSKLPIKLLSLLLIVERNDSNIFSQDLLNLFNDTFKQSMNDSFTKYGNVIIGQKIRPEYILKESNNKIVVNKDNEININYIINGMILNYVSPNFSLFFKYNIYSYYNVNFYDNEQLINKIENSRTLIKESNYNKEKLISLIIEHSGDTLYNILSHKKWKYIGNLFNDYELFSGYLFQIIYSIMCLNTNWIIQNDLHLNNITFNIKNLNVSDNSYSKFIIDDDIYYTKYLGVYPVIIDFGRSLILGDVDKNDLIRKLMKFSELNNNKKYLESEKKKLFIQYSAIDIFKITTSLKIFLDNIYIKTSNEIHHDIIKLLDSISIESFNILSNKKELDDFASKYILKKYFNSHLSRKEKINICDVFVYTNIYNNINSTHKELFNIISNNKKLKLKYNNFLYQMNLLLQFGQI